MMSSYLTYKNQAKKKEGKDVKDAIDCTLYIFDLEYFLTSEWYREIRNDYVSVLSNKKRDIEQEYEEIADI